MSQTLRNLLNRALYLSVADRENSPIDPSGGQINTAIEVFSLVLDSYADYVPYTTKKVLTGISELEKVDAEEITYMIYFVGNVRVPLIGVKQGELESRINQIEGLRSIPFAYWHDKANNAIRVYPNPQTDGDKFEIGYRPTINTDRIDDPLPSAITKTMQQFLIYQTASHLCDEYNVPWTVQKEKNRLLALKNLQDHAAYLEGAQPLLPDLSGGSSLPIPWLAYISGNYPGR